MNSRDVSSVEISKSSHRYGRLLCCILFFVSLQAAICQAETVYVQVSETVVRTTPQHWGKVVIPLKHGEQIEMLEAVESAVPGWIKVKAKNREGYLHRSAVSEKRIVVGAKSAEAISSYSSGDIVLAGKGFNAEVEKEFAARGVNYSEVNRMVARRIPDNELAAFIKKGKLGEVVQ